MSDDVKRMVVWDLRYSLTTGAKRVSGRLLSPALGEESAFVVERPSKFPGKSREYILTSEDWAIDGSSRRRKVADRAARLHAAAASNPALMEAWDDLPAWPVAHIIGVIFRFPSHRGSRI